MHQAHEGGPPFTTGRCLAMIIPHHMLSPEALHRVIEAFVSREGTDDGAHAIPLATKGNRSGYENRNYAAACDFWSLLGSRDGAASPRKAASCAAVRYSKTLRCCCFNVATTVIMLATKREPSSL